MNIKRRIGWLDFVKGLGIISVIISHSISNGVVRGAIFSIHMPLFFIATLMTYKVSTNLQDFIKKTKISIKHLLLPVIAIWIVQVIFFYDKKIYSNLDSYLISQVETLFWASGVKVINTDILPLGIPWFLVVLFISRTIYDYLRLHLDFNKTLIINIILTTVGVILGETGVWLPLSFDLALAVLIFYSIGEYLKNYNFEKNVSISLVLTGFIWAITLLIQYLVVRQYLGHASRDYPLFPLSYISAVAGVMMIIYFSIIISKQKMLYKAYTILSIVGRNSMIILIIHMLEDGAFRFIWEVTDSKLINLIVRLCVDFSIFAIYMYLRNNKKNKVDKLA